MKVMKQKLSLLNKNEFERAVIKLTWGGNQEVGEGKYFNVLIDTLVGQNEKTTREEGSDILVSELKDINQHSWIQGLKTLMIAHYALNTVPQYFGAELRRFQLLDKLKKPAHESHLKNHSQQEVVHGEIIKRYFEYLIGQSERIEQLQLLAGREVSDCESFTRYHDNIRSIIIGFFQVQRFLREMEISLDKFPKIQVMQRVVCLISINLVQAYSILKHIIESLASKYRQFTKTQDFLRFFKLYSEFIMITKSSAYKFNHLRKFIVQPHLNDFAQLELYQLDKTLNQQIELHHLHITRNKNFYEIPYSIEEPLTTFKSSDQNQIFHISQSQLENEYVDSQQQPIPQQGNIAYFS